MEKMTCLRCGEQMRAAGRTRLQLGKAGLLLGSLPTAAAGALAVSVCECPRCGKLEFFRDRTDGADGAETPQVTCPKCGCLHDFDCPRCPNCGQPRYPDL